MLTGALAGVARPVATAPDVGGAAWADDCSIEGGCGGYLDNDSRHEQATERQQSTILCRVAAALYC